MFVCSVQSPVKRNDEEFAFFPSHVMHFIFRTKSDGQTARTKFQSYWQFNLLSHEFLIEEPHETVPKNDPLALTIIDVDSDLFASKNPIIIALP